VAKGANWIDLA